VYSLKMADLPEHPKKKMKRTLRDNNLALEGRGAVVTGGASGIGKAIVKKLAEEGAKVMIADFNKALGEATAKEFQREGLVVEFCFVDVTNEENIAECFEKAKKSFGNVRILVNNAALFIFGHLGPVGTGSKTKTDRNPTDQDWDRMLKTNIMGYAKCMQQACKYMIENEVDDVLYPQNRGDSVINAGCRGAIVNVGSVSSWIAQPEFVPYNATKAAILSMTKCTAKDFAKYKIRVNCVCPGTIETKASYEHMKAINLDVEEGRKAFADSCEMKRQGAPEEVASVCYFLASDLSSFMTGAHVVVDGGGTI